MDITNISRYQNPPREEEYSVLSHLNSREDYLDVFVVSVIRRSPIIYVLINITLLVWLAQTIITSKTQEIPRSVYFISPLFSYSPINQIAITYQDQCPSELGQKILLKTFPTVYDVGFTHKNMFRWGGQENFTFCAKRLNPLDSKFNQNGTCSKVFCNGYCFQKQNSCPITSINKKMSYQSLAVNDIIFFKANDGKSRYIYSKKSGRPIISLLASFQPRCANDFRYLDEFNTLQDYFKIAQQCGLEGTINPFYGKFDQVKAEEFMYNNNRPSIPNELDLQQMQLGSVYQIDFNKDLYAQCSQVKLTAEKATKYLFNDPVEPLFTQSLLVIAFILMVAQIIWLIIFFCIQGYYSQKNVIVILICIIELIVISFIYAQNISLFQTQFIIRSIAKCIQKDIPAASTWDFGIQSSSSFLMIQFVATIFLALFFFAFLMDKLMFQKSTEIYRSLELGNDLRVSAFREDYNLG